MSGSLGSSLISVDSFEEPVTASVIAKLFGTINSKFPAELKPILNTLQWEVAKSYLFLDRYDALNPTTSRLLILHDDHVCMAPIFERFVALVVCNCKIDGKFEGNELKGSDVSDIARTLGISLDLEKLPFLDNFFDGAVSIKTIQSLGTVARANQMLGEISRVCKIQAPVSVTTKFLVRGPNDSTPAPRGHYLFNSHEFETELIENTGLQLIGTSKLQGLDARTLRTRAGLLEHNSILGTDGIGLESERLHPNLVNYMDGFLYSTAHLTLIKRENTRPVNAIHPTRPNVEQLLINSFSQAGSSPMSTKLAFFNLQIAMEFSRSAGVKGRVLRATGGLLGKLIQLAIKIRNLLR